MGDGIDGSPTSPYSSRTVALPMTRKRSNSIVGATGSLSRMGLKANLYETWVRNPAVRELLDAPDSTTTAIKSLKLTSHILWPMVTRAHMTSNISFTVREVANSQLCYFQAVQTIFPGTKASFIGRLAKLVLTFPSYLVWAWREDGRYRPFIWSTWWWSSTLPWFSANLPASASSINEDASDIADDIKAIQPLFRGAHQLCELACLLNVRCMQQAISDLEADASQTKIAAGFMDGAALMQCMTRFLDILAQLDTKRYQEYRPTLKGTSGGDSVNLRALTRLCRSLMVDGDDLATRANEDTVLNAIHSLQYSVGLFWAAHLALAVNANGIDSTGTAGTSIRDMFLHLESMLNTRLNQWIPKYASSCTPRSVWAHYMGKPKELGEAIFASGNYIQIPAPEPQPIVEQARFLFSDEWKGVFLSHSMCPPLKENHVSLVDLQKKHRERLDLGYFYMDVVPRFEQTVLELLNLDTQLASVNIGSNLSEMMYRLMWGLRSERGRVVVSTEADFLSFRAAWRALEREGWKREQVPWDAESLDLAAPVEQAIRKHGRKVGIVHITVVTSMKQIAATEEELKRIVEAARSVGALVFFDVCQAFCNVPYDFRRICGASLRDVFVLGSCVKHARSFEGVGWCAFDPATELIKGAASGWCADLSVLMTPSKDPEFLDARSAMVGGTVSSAVHAELFVEQWAFFRKHNITVEAMSARVQKLHEAFLFQLGEKNEDVWPEGLVVAGRSRRQRYSSVVSKSMTLDCSKCITDAESLAESLNHRGFRVDAREQYFLRIGFDVCHDENDATALAEDILALLG